MAIVDSRTENGVKLQATRLVIVDPHDLSRSGLQMLLARPTLQIDVEAVFADLSNCVEYLEHNRVHILLLDDDLPRTMDLAQVLMQLLDQFLGLAVVVLSDKLSARHVRAALDNGAMGYIYKYDRLQEALPLGIETVRSGHIYVSPKASALPYSRTLQQTLEDLNSTDIDVLRLISCGQTVQEIAAEMQLADRTIYRIRTKLRTALDVRTNEQIIDAARDRGLLDTR